MAYDKAVDRFYVSRIDEEDMQDRVENAMREGREEGIKEGIKEGKLETAKKMKSLGVSTDIIVEATGLSLEEIAEL